MPAHRFLLTLGLGLAAALLCRWLDTPLPWMIGPLFATAVAGMAGVPLSSPPVLRQGGQWVIGTALGLYFTPEVTGVLAAYSLHMAVGVGFALLLGSSCAWLLARCSGIDRTTAYFAMAVGGASEMTSQGERYGAKAQWVAAAHGMRMLIVVAVIPFLFHYARVAGSDPFTPAVQELRWLALAALVLATVAAGVLFARLRIPNAWVIGPLFVCAGLTASGIELSALPGWVVSIGQLFIGISLGARFSPDFLHTAPRYLLSAGFCIGIAMLGSAGFALALAAFSGIHPATAILATSPGGIAEMSLTAKTLELGVPVVTAFHATRMVALVLLAGPLFGLAMRLRRAARAPG